MRAGLAKKARLVQSLERIWRILAFGKKNSAAVIKNML